MNQWFCLICFILDDSVLCKYTIENPEEKKYTVKRLLSNTKYKLVVKAYTSGGETPIVNFIYIDTPFNCEYWLQNICLLAKGWDDLKVSIIFLSQGKTFS